MFTSRPSPGSDTFSEKKPSKRRYERWLGGLYDWKQKRWLWANSGTPLKYHGFTTKNNTGPTYEWKSITMDPNLGFRWNSRLRTAEKHFICQKRAKTIAKLGDFNTGDYSYELSKSSEESLQNNTIPN